MSDPGDPAMQMMQYFQFTHLPEELQAVSSVFYSTARDVLLYVPAGPERTVCLRKLLEAKDAAVRAALPLLHKKGNKA